MFFDKIKNFIEERKDERRRLQEKLEAENKKNQEVIQLKKQQEDEYLTTLKAIIYDKVFLNSDRLEILKKEYNLSDTFAISSIKTLFGKYLNDLIKSETISDSDYQHTLNLMKLFNASSENFYLVQVKYTLWMYENDKPLPDFPSNRIMLKKGEKLYLEYPATLCKYMRHTERVNFHGPILNFKIAKGLKYKFGSLGLSKNTKIALENIDNGYFFITNKRVAFIGEQKNFSYAFDKIIKYGVIDDGLLIQKENLVNPQIISMDNYEVAMAVFSNVIDKM